VLGRGGVVNEDPGTCITSPEQWQPLPGSLDAIARLSRAGWRVVVATNQSGLRRKRLDMVMLNRIHDRMHRQLAEVGGRVDAVFICPCLPRDRCPCRKPEPGMLREIAARLHVSLEGVPCIGDEPCDLEAARAAGAAPWLVRTGHGAAAEASGALPGVTRVFDDLAAAADALLAG